MSEENIVTCFCNSCEIKTLDKPIFRIICHCTFCTRISGGIAVSWVGFKEDKIKIIKGNDIVSYHYGGHIYRYFCKICHSNVYNECISENKKFKACPLSNFKRDSKGQIENINKLKPESHIFYKNCQTCYKDIFENDGLIKLNGFDI